MGEAKPDSPWFDPVFVIAAALSALALVFAIRSSVNGETSFMRYLEAGGLLAMGAQIRNSRGGAWRRALTLVAIGWCSLSLLLWSLTR